MDKKTVYTFSGGPCILPKEVLLQVQDEMLDYKGTGISVMEMSHRSKEFTEIVRKTEKDLRELLDIPDNFKVFFFQGYTSFQHAAICHNLMKDNKRANYLVTGFWGKRAINECKKLGEPHEVIKPTEIFTTCPDASEWDIIEDAAFFHYCENETIEGIELLDFPFELVKGQTLICDMSSNFCTHRINWAEYGMVYAGAQKNVGPAGVSIAIIREDLIGNACEDTTSMFDWEVADKAPEKLYNTPNCWGIYVCGLNLEHMLKKGIDKIAEEAALKSQMVYDCIDSSDGYYVSTVDPKFRSRMNIIFQAKNDKDLSNKFKEAARENGIIELNAPKRPGFIRVSIYNAMPIEGVQALVDFMDKFKQDNP